MWDVDDDEDDELEEEENKIWKKSKKEYKENYMEVEEEQTKARVIVNNEIIKAESKMRDEALLQSKETNAQNIVEHLIFREPLKLKKSWQSALPLRGELESGKPLKV